MNRSQGSRLPGFTAENSLHRRSPNPILNIAIQKRNETNSFYGARGSDSLVTPSLQIAPGGHHRAPQNACEWACTGSCAAACLPAVATGFKNWRACVDDCYDYCAEFC